MPISGDTFSGIGSAVDSIFGGIGQLKAAKGYKKAAQFSQFEGQIAEQATRIQQLQAARDIYRTVGGQRADFGGAGLTLSGGALDVMRDSAAQGALTKQLIAAQGAIDVLGHQAETESYLSMATAAKAAGKGGIIGGVIKAAGTAAIAFSDDRLKEDIRLISRRADGVGIYHWRFKGQPTVFEGVLAKEVERVYPQAVTYEDGFAKVDYGRIGVEPRVVS